MNFLSLQKSNKGFTLIEMLVYMALLILISTAAVASLISMSDMFQQQKAQQLVTRNATVVLERFLSDMRVADAVDYFDSTLTIHPGKIAFIYGATTTSYSMVGGVIETDVDGSVSALTDSSVTVDQLRFYVHDNTVTELARIVMTLSATAGTITHTETFSVGAVLRGSYE